MNAGVVLLYIAGASLGVVGVALLLASIFPACRRGEPVFETFLAPREMFTGRELLLNRVGLCLSIAGIAMTALLLFYLGG